MEQCISHRNSMIWVVYHLQMKKEWPREIRWQSCIMDPHLPGSIPACPRPALLPSTASKWTELWWRHSDSLDHSDGWMCKTLEHRTPFFLNFTQSALVYSHCMVLASFCLSCISPSFIRGIVGKQQTLCPLLLVSSISPLSTDLSSHLFLLNISS